MKKIKNFSQHTPETCGISCILMVLNYYKVREGNGRYHPTVSKEMYFYQRYGAESTPGTLGASIARAFAERGLSVRLVHSSPDMLENTGGYFAEHIHRAMLREHKANIVRANGRFSVETGVRVDCARIRKELDEGGMVVVQCMVGGDEKSGMMDKVPHWILIHDYEKGKFIGRDPLEGIFRKSEQELEAMLDTPLGRSFISVVPGISKRIRDFLRRNDWQNRK